MSASSQIRLLLAAFKKQEGRCIYCLLPIDETNATWEHIIPRGWGGIPGHWNKVLACQRCNSIKSGMESQCHNHGRAKLRLTSKAALFILRCSKKYKEMPVPARDKVYLYRMATIMMSNADYHANPKSCLEVPIVSSFERHLFL